jgi:hypothetical protein
MWWQFQIASGVFFRTLASHYLMVGWMQSIAKTKTICLGQWFILVGK